MYCIDFELVEGAHIYFNHFFGDWQRLAKAHPELLQKALELQQKASEFDLLISQYELEGAALD